MAHPERLSAGEGDNLLICRKKKIDDEKQVLPEAANHKAHNPSGKNPVKALFAVLYRKLFSMVSDDAVTQKLSDAFTQKLRDPAT